MRWSKCFIPTLREDPAGVETAAFRLLVRAGYLRAVSAGVYAGLPLAMRCLARLRRIAREALATLEAQETSFDAAAAAAVARGELRGSKQLPQVWYRLESPLLRLRQFAGLDVYTFGLERETLAAALANLVQRAGVVCVWSSGGAVALQAAGPDTAAVCGSCGAAAALTLAQSTPAPSPPDPPGDLTPEPFHTPGLKTIADLARFTGLPEAMHMKSLVLVAAGSPVLVLLRGDHQLSPAKFAARSADEGFRPAAGDEMLRWFGASAGSLGPVGVTTMPVWMDAALAGRRNMICGANRDDYHLRHVTPGEDFEPATIADLRETAAGDGCMSCGAALELRPAIELVRVSEQGARVSLERLLLTAVEANHDADGMILPAAIAPFDVIVTDAGAAEVAERVYRDLEDAGYDVLFDDRDQRPGVKFKDADLIGVPWRVTVGRKAAEGLVEVVHRATRVRTDMPIENVASFRSSAEPRP
jgi:prolyl-tRNA synthetase